MITVFRKVTAHPSLIDLPARITLLISDRASLGCWFLRGTKYVPRAKTNESLKPVAFAVVPRECTGICVLEGTHQMQIIA